MCIGAPACADHALLALGLPHFTFNHLCRGIKELSPAMLSPQRAGGRAGDWPRQRGPRTRGRSAKRFRRYIN